MVASLSGASGGFTPIRVGCLVVRCAVQRLGRRLGRPVKQFLRKSLTAAVRVVYGPELRKCLALRRVRYEEVVLCFGNGRGWR